jgi:cytochrome c oxidase subunit 2
LATLLLAGCGGVQSALDPAGAQAATIHRLGWIMIVAGALIFLCVLALTTWAIYAPERSRAWLGSGAMVIWGGIVFPVAALTALLLYGLAIAADIVGAPGEPPLRIEVIGERWWWRVHYLAEDGGAAVISANEVRIPVGRPVEFILSSANVIHSFWAPALGGKLDMIPGRETRLVLEAERPGIYRGQCAEYCGEQHALMAFLVVAQEPENFARWLPANADPAPEPTNEAEERGQAIFSSFGCGACHTIAGTEAAGIIGPDLTHVGGRLTLAAGTLPNNPRNMEKWIAGSQAIKPDNLMPSYSMLGPDDLAALAAYLESLR